VIGAVLVFGFVVVLFATYQAQVVPSQNKNVEFDHSIAVQNDMVELRNEILTAKTAGRTTFADVKLGTKYENRYIAVNPAPASGTLFATDPRPITVDVDGSKPNFCPSSNTIETRTLRFQPGYNEYQGAPDIVYENTVLYLDFDDRQIPLTDEKIVRDNGNIVDIVPLNTSFYREGVRRASVEPIPGNVKENEVENANITLPTNLSQDHWEDLLSEDLPPENVTVSDGNLTIETGGEISVACSPLGLNAVPAGGAREDAGTDINPAGPNEIEVRDFRRPNNEEIEVDFNNTGDRDTNITQARIAFYHNPSDTGGDLGPINMSGPSTSLDDPSIQLALLDPVEPLDPDITLSGNNTGNTTIRFRNEGGEKIAKEDFFVVQFVFENGKQGTYFVDVPQ
jgi:hypothetical protein